MNYDDMIIHNYYDNLYYDFYYDLLYTLVSDVEDVD